MLVSQSLVAVFQQVGMTDHKLSTGSIILVLDVGPGRVFVTCRASRLQFSTRGTVDSDNWFLRLSDQAVPRRYHLPDNG